MNTELSFPPFVDIKFFIATTTTTNTNAETDISITSESEIEDDFRFEPDYYDESSDTQDGNEFEEFEETSQNLVTEPKFIVFWTCLLSLFRFCFTCFKPTTVTSVRTKGSILYVKIKCINNHIHNWLSQPPGQGNIQIAAAILYSGNTFGRISEMLTLMNIQHFSHTLFYNIQKTLLYPVLNSFYKQRRDEIIEQCKQRELNNFIGDGRSDSPGYSAKYGTYSLMSTDLGKIVDFYVVHVGTVENSSRMEKKGLETLLDRFSNLGITTLTTDRHIQIRAFMKKYHPEILHQFDVWHFGSIKKNLSNIAKKKECGELKLWIKSIVNHFWWCCASADGNVDMLREKWTSILNHIVDVHEWEGNKYFHNCEHGVLEKKRTYLKFGSPAFVAVQDLVNSKRTLSDLHYLIKFCHTGNLEVYYSVINKYCPKRIHFSLLGMIARTQLAVLDFNSDSNRNQATRKDGTLRYKQVFSRVTQNWVVKKIVEQKDTKYRDELMALMSNIISTDLETLPLPCIPEIPQNIAPLEKPNKDEAIRNMITRFIV